jgi:hypothetical protein
MNNFVKGQLSFHKSLTSKEVQQALTKEFGISISLTVINDFRRVHDLIRIQEIVLESGASDMLIALALDSGFINSITDIICQHVRQLKASDSFRESVSKPKAHSEQRSHGLFTSEYNRSLDVRTSRFQSLDEKIWKKHLVSMGIFSHSRFSMMRYTLALFSLPLVTMNGRVLRCDNPRGKALQYLCGYNYKAATLNKYLIVFQINNFKTANSFRLLSESLSTLKGTK